MVIVFRKKNALKYKRHKSAKKTDTHTTLHGIGSGESSNSPPTDKTNNERQTNGLRHPAMTKQAKKKK